jgi:MHS family proline/betaine transporter-like MFS transporter
MTARSRLRRNVGAAIIGNTLEWFDILVYAYFVKAIAANFFPASDPVGSLLLAYGTFGLSFVARPLGALVLGRIADRDGRRTALVYATLLMFVGTAAIAALPPYRTIGVAAPILLLAARLVQGFSAGGEFGSATAYLAEQSPNRRGFYASCQFASQGLGMAMAALVGLILASWLTPAALLDWGWRIPFLLGAIAGPFAYLVRRTIDETSEFLAVEADVLPPEPGQLARFVVRCLAGAGAVLACTVPIYFLVYIPSFAQTMLHADPRIAYAGALVSGATLLVGSPIAGLLADRIGALRLGLWSSALIAVVAYPIFAMMVAGHNEASILWGLFALAIATALYLGALPAILADLFDTSRRSLGLAISYNLAVMIAGGFAQMIFVLLISSTGAIVAPSYYVTAAAVAAWLALLFCRKLAAVDRDSARR